MTKLEMCLLSGAPLDGVAGLKAEFEALPQPDKNSARETWLEGLEKTFSPGKQVTPDQLNAVFRLSPLLLSQKDFVRADEKSLSPEDRLTGLTAGALARQGPASRGELISTLIQELADISLLCGFFVSAASTDFGPEMGQWRRVLMLRIEKMRASGDLWQQASLAPILWFSWTCEEQNTYINVQRAFHEPKAVQALLEAAIERRLTPQGEIDLILVRRWSKILDFQGLEAKALELALNGSSRQERARARRFLTAFGNGKSELYN